LDETSAEGALCAGLVFFLFSTNTPTRRVKVGFFPASNVTYNGTIDSSYLSYWGGSGSTFPLDKGLFFSSIQAASFTTQNTPPQGTNDGCFGIYGLQYDFSYIDDSAEVVFIGRQKPVSELGQFFFAQGKFSFKIPPPGVIFSTGVATNWSPASNWSNGTWAGGSGWIANQPGTNGTSTESCLRAIVARQHASSAGLCRVQTARGQVYVGVLDSLDFQTLDAGWTQATGRISEVGIV
jgi:hypothetical protein